MLKFSIPLLSQGRSLPLGCGLAHVIPVESRVNIIGFRPSRGMSIIVLVSITWPSVASLVLSSGVSLVTVTRSLAPPTCMVKSICRRSPRRNSTLLRTSCLKPAAAALTL